jgi:hypothetical protein
MVKFKDGVSLLLDIGADPNLRASDTSTPLWNAVKKSGCESKHKSA